MVAPGSVIFLPLDPHGARHPDSKSPLGRRPAVGVGTAAQSMVEVEDDELVEAALELEAEEATETRLDVGELIYMELAYVQLKENELQVATYEATTDDGVLEAGVALETDATTDEGCSLDVGLLLEGGSTLEICFSLDEGATPEDGLTVEDGLPLEEENAEVVGLTHLALLQIFFESHSL